MSSKTITIVGAGLSGLVAGINLAKDGHKVRILEAKETVGGKAAYIDSTYISPADITAYTGVNIDTALDPWKQSKIYAYGKVYDIINPEKMESYTVERGRGSASLDNILYQQALEAGVTVELGSKVSPADIRKLPADTIIATGLSGEVFQALNLPCRPFYCYLATGTVQSTESRIIVYFDNFAREYGYYFQARGIAGALAFNANHPLNEKEKQTFRENLSHNDGVTFDNWNEDMARWAAWPIGPWNTLRLFHEDKIITGTLAGAVNPVILFGVHGALVSGKIAARAVTDRDGALKEFNRLNPGHYPQTALRKYRQIAPHFLLKPMFRMILATYHPRYMYHTFLHTMAPPGMGYLQKLRKAGRLGV